jgi:hypothetical protein
MTDYKQLCAELTDHLSEWYAAVVSSGTGYNTLPVTKDLLSRARAALNEGKGKTIQLQQQNAFN